MRHQGCHKQQQQHTEHHSTEGGCPRRMFGCRFGKRSMSPNKDHQGPRNHHGNPLEKCSRRRGPLFMHRQPKFHHKDHHGHGHGHGHSHGHRHVHGHGHGHGRSHGHRHVHGHGHRHVHGHGKRSHGHGPHEHQEHREHEHDQPGPSHGRHGHGPVHRGHPRFARFQHQHECRRSKSPVRPQRRHSFSFGEGSSNQHHNCHLLIPS